MFVFLCLIATDPLFVDSRLKYIFLVFNLKEYILYTLLSLSGNSGRLTLVRLQKPQEQRCLVLQVHAGSFSVSVIYRTQTRTTGSLTCGRDHSFACVYTHGGWAESQHNIFFTRKNSHKFFLCSSRGQGSNPGVFGP